MPKEKLKVPDNCPIEIWVSDNEPVDEGCFARGSVLLPDNYMEITLPNGSKILMPPCIDILVPGQIGLQRFYYFAQGSFNAAFRNFSVDEGKDANEAAKLLLFPPAVFKLPLAREEASVVAQLDEPKRHARVFNESNKDALEKAIENSKNKVGQPFFGKAVTLGNGIIEPYIIGVESTSEQKCNRLIQLYNKEQRIVVDSDVKNNLLTDESDRIWIVDTGFALQLGSKDPIDEQVDAMRQPSPKSEASFCVWNAEDGKYSEYYGYHFLQSLFPSEYNQKLRPQKKEEIKKLRSIPPELLLSMALLYIQKEYPAVKDVSCLENNPGLISHFAAAYIEQVRKKYFDKSQEMIPALKINQEDEEKLIGINELPERLAKLIEENIDRAETAQKIQVEIEGSLKTPAAASMQVSLEGGLAGAQVASQSNTLLRTAKLGEVKKAILGEIDKRVKEERYAQIPWSISFDAPVANIGFLQSIIKQSKDLEDMQNRLTNLIKMPDVKANQALLELYQNSLNAIKGFKSQEGIIREGIKTEFDNAFKTQYGEHANKLVPVKTELERQILGYIKSANKDNKTKAYQLIQDIHRCENEGQVIEKIEKTKIYAKGLINCCNIIMKPIFKDYPDDLKYCSNQVSMIALYKVRKTANEAKNAYNNAKNTLENPNAKLIAQLNKIKTELEYRKTLYKIRGAESKKSWWTWSLNNKLFSADQMIKYIEGLQARLDKNAPPSQSDITLPDLYAAKEGKLGDILKEISTQIVPDSRYAIAYLISLSKLSHVTLLAQQPAKSDETKRALDQINREVDIKYWYRPDTAFFNGLSLLNEKIYLQSFPNQQSLILCVLENLFPDENQKLSVENIPEEQRAPFKIAFLQQVFQAELRNNPLLSSVIEQIRLDASVDIVGIIDSLAGVNPDDIASVSERSSIDDEVEEEAGVVEQPAEEKQERRPTSLSTPVFRQQELPKHMKPSAKPAGADSESSDDDERIKPQASAAAAAAAAASAASSDAVHVHAPISPIIAPIQKNDFENFKTKIAGFLEKVLQGQSFREMATQVKKCENIEQMYSLIQSRLSKGKMTEHYQGRLEVCLIAIERKYPDIAKKDQAAEPAGAGGEFSGDDVGIKPPSHNQ